MKLCSEKNKYSYSFLIESQLAYKLICQLLYTKQKSNTLQQQQQKGDNSIIDQEMGDLNPN